MSWCLYRAHTIWEVKLVKPVGPTISKNNHPALRLLFSQENFHLWFSHFQSNSKYYELFCSTDLYNIKDEAYMQSNDPISFEIRSGQIRSGQVSSGLKICSFLWPIRPSYIQQFKSSLLIIRYDPLDTARVSVTCDGRNVSES